MRILHVIVSMDPESGGPCQGIRNFEIGNKDSNVTRQVVCLDKNYSKYLNKDTFKINALGDGKGRWQYSKKLIPWLTVNLEKFDVVIIHGLWQYHSYAIWKVIKDLKKQYPNKKLPKVLVMPHGMLDPYFQFAKGRRIKAVRNFFYWKFIENIIINNVDGLLFTCEAELLLARKTFTPYNPQKEYNVGYGVATPPVFNDHMTTSFKEHCPGLKESPYWLFLGRIHEKKGVDLLINAYKLLSNQYTAMPKLVIAGPGLETAYGKKVQALAKGDSSKSIFFTGMLSGDAKWGAYYGCEAFVLTSHQENFGISVAEALACSKPVLISDQVNIYREIKTGGIVGSDNLESVKNIIEKWIKLSTSEKSQMSKNAFLVFKENFEIEPVSQKVNDVLYSLLDI